MSKSRATKSQKLSISVVSLLSCFGIVSSAWMQTALAEDNSDEGVNLSQFQAFKSDQGFALQPRFTVAGISGDSTFTHGQLLVPVYGDATNSLYLVTEGGITKKDSVWNVGAGVGYRQIFGDNIFGGYAIADYVNMHHKNFIIMNPGLEMLGNIWDVRVNGYIPIDNRKKLGDEGWACDDFGICSMTHPTGHEYWDHRMQQYEEPKTGLDVDVAHVVPYINDAKVHLGAYHFDSSDFGSTNGIRARATYDLNKYISLEAQNSYDNTKHNQFLLGMSFNLGGYSSDEKEQYGLVTRLTDPIDYVNLTPIISDLADKGSQKQHDNVWYTVAGSGTGGSGTAEDPFVGFTQAHITSIGSSTGVIDRYPLLFFTPGTYNLTGAGFATDGRFSLPTGWGMYGKTAGYKAPAMGGNRPEFDGRIDITNTPDATTLDSVQIVLNGASSTSSTLYASNANNVILRNTNITATGDNVSDAIQAVNHSVINFEKLNNVTDGTNTVTINDAAASSINGKEAIEVTNSTINFISGTNIITADSGTSPGFLGGLEAATNSQINFIGGANTIQTINTDGWATGIYASASQITFSGGTNTISSRSTTALGADNAINLVNSSINFANNDNNKVTLISETGNTSNYGIYADAASSIQTNGTAVSDLNNLFNLVNFSTTEPSKGYAVDWGEDIPAQRQTLAWPTL